jgi:hypothetical protein
MTCKFSETPRDEQGKFVIGAQVRVCKRMPPTPILIPRGPNLSLESAWPVLPLTGHCFEFAVNEQAANVVEPNPGSVQ